MCEQKRRYQERDEIGVQLGLRAYLRFYEITQGSSRLRTWEDFSQSSFYRAFVKFGRYCQDTRAINVSRFIDWLINGNHKIDTWDKDSVYERYLMELIRTETANDAVDRAQKHAQDWNESSGYPGQHYLRHANPNAVCFAVTTGRISPWVLYNTASGEEFLSGLTDHHVAMIWPWIDTDFWQRRFGDFPADAAWVREILTQQGW